MRRLLAVALLLSGCATLRPSCWTANDSAPCYCSTSTNPCCQKPLPAGLRCQNGMPL